MAVSRARQRARRLYRQGDIVHDDRGEALELQQDLGEGGQGSVWSLSGERTAVKLLKPEADIDTDELRARVAAVRRFDLIGIPIARPLSLLVGDDVGYTMELLAGMTSMGSLASLAGVPPGKENEWFQGTGGLSRRLRLLALAAEALSRLHARGLAYGDISPGNILVSERSEHDQVWLIDPDSVTVHARQANAAHITEGYAAPELISGRAGQDSLTDAFGFAVLAFQVLTLVHPFFGDGVAGDATLETAAFGCKLPWIDHSTDDSNRSASALPRELALTRGLRRLSALTFEEGLHDPERRPSVGEWHDKLDQAALLMVTCPGCGGSYHAAEVLCPWCRRQERPPILLCDIHGYLPAGAAPGISGEAETGRLRSIILPSCQGQLVRARNGLLCLDRGPSTAPVDPSEPLAELSWSGGPLVMIQRVGRHSVWVVNRSARRSAALSPGETWPLDLAEAGRWAVHFGDKDEAHRFLRILTQQRVV